MATSIQSGQETGFFARPSIWKLLNDSVVENFIFFLIFLNITTFILGTVDTIWAEGWVPTVFGIVETVSCVIFTLEYLARFFSCPEDKAYAEYSAWEARARFTISFFSIIDLLAIVPFWVDIALPGDDEFQTAGIRIFRLVLLLKGDENDETLAIFGKVWERNREMLKTSLFCGIVLWLVCSTFLYYAEHDDHQHTNVNPHITQAERFQSVPHASWYTLILLSGDYPLIDFTIYGKICCFFMMFIAVGIVGIPTGIMATGFSDAIEAREKEKAKANKAATANAEVEEPEEEKKSSSPNSPEKSGSAGNSPKKSPLQKSYNTFGGDKSVTAEVNEFRVNMYKFLHHPERSGTAAQIFQYFIFGLIIANTAAWFVASESHSIGDGVESYDVWTGGKLEIVTVFIFTIEYFFRLWSIVEEEDKALNFNSPWSGRWNYATTFLALIDLASFLPWYVDLTVSENFFPCTFLRIFRLANIFTNPEYTRAFDLFDDIFVQNKEILISTGFAATVTWIFCATGLYFTEKDNTDDDINYRFASIPRSMWYTMVMLTGEFPVNSFTPLGKVIGSFVALLAVAVFGVPTGIVGASFLSLYSGDDDDDDDDDDDADEELDEEALKEFETNKTKRCLECRVIHAEKQGLRSRMHLFMCADTFWGSFFEKFIFALIFLNITTFVLSTVDTIESSDEVQTWFNYIELVSVIIFTVEYVSRVWAVVEEEDYADPIWGRISYMSSFFGLVDLMAILPFYIDIAIDGFDNPQHGNGGFSTTFLRVFRLVRVLKAEKYMESLTLLDDVVRANKGLLMVTGFVSLLMWIVMGVGFYTVQSEHNCLGEGANIKKCVPSDLWNDVHETNYFGTISNALWPTLLMLSSEFPLADFNLGGCILGFIMVLFAVGLFGNFIGIIADGFETVFGERAAAKKKSKKVKFYCNDCNKRLEHFYWMDLDAFK